MRASHWLRAHRNRGQGSWCRELIHALGCVHALVGKSEQNVDLRAIDGRACASNACLDGQRVPLEFERTVDELFKSSNGEFQSVVERERMQQDAKLISTQSGRCVRFAHGGRQPPREFTKNRVAGAVTVPVVDGLQPIEIKLLAPI